MKYHVSFDIEFKANSYPGLLIALEGIDGSGKTTQAKRLQKIFQRAGYTVFLTKNPTNGIIGRMIRKILNGKLSLSPISFQYLYSADRQLQQEEIISHLKKREIVITDRYFWSAIAYGMSDKEGRYTSQDMFMAAHCVLSWYHQHMLPNYTFYLDTSVETAMQRLSAMHKKADIYERKYKMKKIVEGYTWLLQKFPQEITRINAEQSLEIVTNAMLAVVQLEKNERQKRISH